MSVKKMPVYSLNHSKSVNKDHKKLLRERKYLRIQTHSFGFNLPPSPDTTRITATLHSLVVVFAKMKMTVRFSQNEISRKWTKWVGKAGPWREGGRPSLQVAWLYLEQYIR